MSAGAAITATGVGLTGTAGVLATVVGGSPWPVVAALAVAAVAVGVLGVVVLTAARTTDPARYEHSHAVLCTLVFAARGRAPMTEPAVGPPKATNQTDAPNPGSGSRLDDGH